MHTKQTVIKITNRNSVKQNCGDCLHFKRNAKFEKPCSQLGVKHYASAPQCFSPDVYVLARKSPDALFQIGLLFHNFTPSESRILLSLLNQQKTFEKGYSLKFGQPVYFRLGTDYLSNYFRGYVAGVASAGDQQVYVTSDMNGAQSAKPVIATLMRDSVFSVTEFKTKRASLQERGRLMDPNPEKKHVVTKIDAKYEIPSMEKAPADWYESFGARLNSSKKLKRGKDNSLTFKVKNTA